MCGECEGKNKERTRVLSTSCCQPLSNGEPNPCIAEYHKQLQEPSVQRNKCIGDYEKHLYEPPNPDFYKRGPVEPYQIPGYDGHVPTLQHRQGETYGHETHEVMTAMDPCKPTVSYDGKEGPSCAGVVCDPYQLPGYTGHVPGLQFMVGGTYGQDTHKLLSITEPYPNRQENLSPYRPENSMEHCYGLNKGDGEHNGSLQINDLNGLSTTTQQTTPKSETTYQTSYRRPDEYYLRPQYKYRLGDTYATTGEVTLVDPCVNEESKVIVSTRELDDTQVVRTQDTMQERIECFPYIYQPIRHRPWVPGFDAYIDALRGARGQRFEFNYLSPEHKHLQQQIVLHRGSVKEPLNMGFRGDANKHGLPSSNGSGKIEDDLPFGYKEYEGRPQTYTNSALYDFTSNYRRRQSTEWAPATISRADPPALDVPGEIYNKHMGLLPGYSAHIPGAKFRCGKTFTDDSRDARKALRGDRF